MSAEPITTTGDALSSAALRTMRQRGVRHLPVMQGAQIVGVHSERNVFFAQISSNDAATVGQAMQSRPYVVAPDLSVADVARMMLERRVGSARVVEFGRLAGIVTSNDARRALLRAT